MTRPHGRTVRRKPAHAAATATVIALIALPAIQAGCRKRTFGDTRTKAINIRDGHKVSRVYMAYDETSPARVAWYYCKEEPLDTDTVRQALASSEAHPILDVGRAVRKRAVPSGTARAEERAEDAAPSEAVLGDASRRPLYLDERMTFSDFNDKSSGKGCQQLIGPGVAGSARSAADGSLSNGGEDLTAPVFSALASCAGLTKESLLVGSVVLSGNKETIKGLLGFKGSQLTRQNVGGTLVSLFGGAVFCGFGSKGLFKKLSDVQDVRAVSNKVFLSYFDGVLKTADAVFTGGAEGDADEAIKARVRELPVSVRDRIKADSVRFQGLMDEKKALEASAVFMPYVVGTWNVLHARDVAPNVGATGNLGEFIRGFLGGLARRLGLPVPEGTPPETGPADGTDGGASSAPTGAPAGATGGATGAAPR